MNEYELQQVIRNWVSDNFGESEAKDPSWNIEALSKHVAKHFNDKTQYNGWSNYATWRVNLEFIDSEVEAVREEGEVYDTISDLADHFQQMVDDYFELNLDELDPKVESFALSTMHSYSDAFLSDVNWYEIAQNVVSDNPEFVKEKK